MLQIGEYTIALTNLYGIIEKDLAVEIYNKQNSKKNNKDDLEEAFEAFNYHNISFESEE